jgi:hypothetical protein
MKIHWVIVLFAASICAGCSSLPSTNPAEEYVSEIVLSESQLEGLARAKKSNGTDYTYAVSASGHCGYIGRTGKPSVRGALMSANIMRINLAACTEPPRVL